MMYDAPKRHELKTWPEHFREVVAGRKTAEVRLDDRGFGLGHVLWLREWDPTEGAYTGREATAEVTHVLKDTSGLKAGFVMLSFGRVTAWYVQPDPTRDRGNQ